MSVQEIFSSEKRNKDSLFDIHFYMEGSFWRAYEWSAYLSRIFPSDLSDKERLKVIKKSNKEGNKEYVLIGLPMPSFDKYFPNVMKDDMLFEIKDKQITIHAKSFFSDTDFSDYENILNDFKNSIKITKKEENKKEEHFPKTNDKSSIGNILKEIKAYPIENKTLLESIEFLNYIKNELFKITI